MPKSLIARIILGLLALIVLAVVAGGSFLALKKPAQRPASTETVERTPERLARGKYLAEVQLNCMGCHTPPEPTRWSLLGDPAQLGGGGLCWDEQMEFPGKLCAKNLTPDPETGLGAWTDGEIIRAFREGISRDGTPLFPVMPYLEYRALPDDDARALVVYLRSLKPVRNVLPPRELKPPLSIIVKFMPKPLAGPVAAPDHADPVAYGKYLAGVSNCRMCHTPVDDKHQPVPGKDFAGGQLFKYGALSVKSANLTPHATGLGDRTKEAFIGMFRSFGAPEMASAKIPLANNTVMPWLSYSALTDEDLGAIYAYLRTVPAIENAVERRPPPAAPAVAH